MPTTNCPLRLPIRHGVIQVRRSLRKGVRDIIDRVGVTSIIVTHDQEEAFDIADRVIIFNRCVGRGRPA